MFEKCVRLSLMRPLSRPTRRVAQRALAWSLSRSSSFAPALRSSTRSRWRCRLVLGGLLLTGFGIGPAAAQFAGSLSVDNDYRLRGYSISGGRPVASLNLSYDLPSGVYANGVAIGTLDRQDEARLLGVIGNLGYARMIANDLSLDAGVSRTQYDHYVAGPDRGAHYTEFYLGLLTSGFSSHLYLSPDYLHGGVTSIYGEIDGALRPIHRWRLSAHVGMLGYLAAPDTLHRSTQYDWRTGIARRLGPFDIHAAITGGGPGADHYYGRSHSRTAVVGGASWTF